MDPKEIFELKYAILMGFLASGLVLSYLVVIVAYMSFGIFSLINASLYFTTLAQAGTNMYVTALYIANFIFGLIFSGLMLLTTIFLLQEDSIILFNHPLEYTELGIMLIIFSIFNLIFGSHGFFVGGILGIISGSFVIAYEYFHYKKPIADRKRQEKLKTYKQKKLVKPKSMEKQKPIFVKVDENSDMN